MTLYHFQYNTIKYCIVKNIIFKRISALLDRTALVIWFLLYWAKVLPEQWKLILIFRKHEIFRKKLRMHVEQAIIPLSKSLNLILIKSLQLT